ncbi:M16 family metallopeptidase [Bdellovibrio sp. HCB337]|uniref:M16 family metallopeptidase n=1 Tax=Bdellovibrio sp. HCB337 TaxID=3394358 RepID=UPI0039A6A7E9
MKLFLCLALVFQVSAAVAAPQTLEDVEKTKKSHKINDLITANEYQMANGLTVFLTENPKAPDVVVAHWVKAGSLHETPGITGIAHLFEHMMFRPIAPGAPTFFDIAGKLGADFNANTRFESTFYFTSVAPAKWTELLKHEADRFQKIVVTKEMLDAERKAVWSEYSTKFDANPVIDLWFQSYQQAYKGHPFGWMIIGNREDLEKITAEDCNTFFQKYYKPNNTGLFITGNFKTKEALQQVLKLYGDWKPSETAAQPPKPYDIKKAKEIIGEGKLPSDAKFTLFGIRTPYFDKDNAKLLTVFNNILFDGENGLLKMRLVDDKQIASSASDFNFDYDNGMIKAAIVSLPKTKMSQLRAELLEIPKDFDKMSEADFNTYKKNAYIRMAEGNQRNQALSDALALTWGKYGNIDITKELISAPLDVTKEQMKKFIAQYYVPENFVILTHKGQKN